jgi:hypothetical protein
MRLPGIQHPPVVLEPLHRPTVIGHHAEDVVELEHGQAISPRR